MYTSRGGTQVVNGYPLPNLGAVRSFICKTDVTQLIKSPNTPPRTRTKCMDSRCFMVNSHMSGTDPGIF